MRARALALLAVSLLLALMMGVASPAHAAPAPPSGPKIISAKLVKDGGVRGELDAGDKVRITFNRDVKISEPESWGLSLIGRNGSTMRLDPESAPYGFY